MFYWANTHNFLFYVTIGGIIITSAPTKSVNFELSAELTFPIKTGNSTGFMVLLSCITTAVFGWLIGSLLGDFRTMSAAQLQTNL